MKVKLSLHRPSGAVEDLVVTADGTATVGSVADAIARCDPRPGPGDRPIDRPAGHPGDRSGADPAGSRTLSVARNGAYVPLDPLLGVGESGLRSGSVVALTPASQHYGGDPGPAAAIVTVVSGPGEGARFEVPAGVTLIGRAPECGVRLRDPLVSKQHARLSVRDVVELVDLNSANGILVGGSPTRQVLLGPDDTAVLGDTGIQVTALLGTATAAGAAGGIGAAGAGAGSAGHGVAFNRSPRVLAPYPASAVALPEPPGTPEGQRFPLISVVVPVLVAAVLYAVTRSTVSILFAALSPLMLVGQWLETRLGGRRGHRAAVAAYRERLAQLSASLADRAAREVAVRDQEHPSTAAVLDAIGTHGPLLWAHRRDTPGFLELRLGVGAAPSRTELELPRTTTTTAQLDEEIAATAARFASVQPVPVVGALRQCGSLGVAGPVDAAVPVARGLLTQLIGLHSPADVVLAAVTDAAGAARWSWLRWVPHTCSEHSPLPGHHLGADAVAGKALVAALEELVAQRRDRSAAAGADTPADRVSVVVLVEDAAPVERARLVWLAEHGPAAGVHLIWIAPSVPRLPAPCRRFLHLTGPGPTGHVGDADSGDVIEPVAVEMLDERTAEGVGRVLAPILDAGARTDDVTDLPAAVSLIALAGTELAEDAAAVHERWLLNGSLAAPDGSRAGRARGHALTALIGVADTEKFYLDLRAHGPHALVGGTTGAGKSEFLQSWVLGLATNYSPERVTFLFVDYKGGSAFGECHHLPHTVGMITDLTQHRFTRTLTSLRAELRFREHLLNTKKAKELLELEKRGDPDCPPSLVIVVDEFAALVQDVPEFVDGMVDIAQRGRSLGLHLVLATQRPTGVIKDNLRANTNLRIALRMADESDSTDVLGSVAAAAIAPGIPGRGYAKTGPGRLTAFQCGYAGGWTASRPAAPTVTVEELAFGPPVRWEEPDVGHVTTDAALGPTDMQRTVATIRQAARLADVPPPRKPWLATLAATYHLDQLPTRRLDGQLVFAVLDDPDHQRQHEVAFRPDVEGNLAVFGTGGAGKSALLRSLAVAAGFTARGGPCHVYGLDFASRGLAMLEPLPHVGAVIPGEDRERVSRLLHRLRRLVDERAARYAQAGAGTITEYRQRQDRPDEARVLVLVDGVGAFRQADESQREALWDLFVGVAADGRQVGVHVVVAADRPTAVTSALNSVIQKRVVLRMATADDYSSLGLRADAMPTSAPPGRGYLDGHEIQVAVLGGTANTAEQARAVQEVAAAMVRAGVRDAEPVRILEPQIPLADLPTQRGGLPVVGVDGPSLEPFALDVRGTLLLAGPPGSGRTTCTATLVLAARRSGAFQHVVYLGPGASPLVRLHPWSQAAVGADRIAATAQALTEHLAAPGAAPTLVVLESAGDYLEGDVDAQLGLLAKTCAATGHAFLAEGESSTFTRSYSALFPVLKNARRGVVLQPDVGDGDTLLRTSVPAVPRAQTRPGRGYVVQGTSVRLVQFALPELADDHTVTVTRREQPAGVGP